MTDIIGQLQRNRDAQSDAERSRAADRTSRATDPRSIAPDAIVEVKVISRRESTLLHEPRAPLGRPGVVGVDGATGAPRAPGATARRRPIHQRQDVRRPFDAPAGQVRTGGAA